MIHIMYDPQAQRPPLPTYATRTSGILDNNVNSMDGNKRMKSKDHLFIHRKEHVKGKKKSMTLTKDI